MRITPMFVALLAAAAATATAAGVPVETLGAPARESRTWTSAALICPSFLKCVELTVDMRGDGNGVVTTSPPGINCTVRAGVESGDCTETFSWPQSEPAAVRWTVTADGDSDVEVADSRQPSPWIGTVTYEAGQASTFGVGFILEKRSVSVTRSGLGTGRVTSEPAGINCAPICQSEFGHGTAVTLTAAPNAGAVFTAWTGACTGQGARCTLTVTANISTNAAFGLAGTSPPPPPPPPPSSPPAPPSPSSPPPPPPADRIVDADVGAAAAGRTKLGARVARIELSSEETLAATLELRRAGKLLASKRYGRVRAGERLLMILVPPRLLAGPATLRLTLADLAGNKRGARRQIALGRI